MKLKKLNLILIIGIIIVLSANAGICTEDIAQHVPAAANTISNTIPAKEDTGISLTLTKFIITMVGVLLSSIVIWLGLTIYNKFFVKNRFKQASIEDDTMNTPKTIEEAVTFFIKKNRLK